MPLNTKIAIFKGKRIRRTIYNKEWWFSVVDVVEALTDSANPRDYWYKMKIREKDESGVQLSTICRQLKLEASDGKKYETDCADTEGMLRIVQSIPSPKPEEYVDKLHCDHALLYKRSFSAQRQNWKRLLKDAKCAVCNRAGKLHVHHIVALDNGGFDEIENLIVICHLCHETLHPHMKKRPKEWIRPFETTS